MARKNVPVSYSQTTHEGAAAELHMKPAVELERAVSTCMLWENTFYESGDSIAARIEACCALVTPEQVALLAVRARNEMKLRHVPLFLCVQLAARARGRTDGLVKNTIAECIQRPDEMGEFLTMYWKGGRRPLSGQIKKGLREAYTKFDPYQLAKWNRKSAIKLRDIMFLVSPHPTDGVRVIGAQNVPDIAEALQKRKDIFKAIADRKKTPVDTWEASLSGGKDKKATWTRLLEENKLGYMALLMNLRNMIDVGVDNKLIRVALIHGAPGSKALPFRFISAAKHAPALEDTLGEAMLLSMDRKEKVLPGKTILIVDISGSMRGPISGKSDVSRLDTACALAMLVREVCEDPVIFATSGQDYGSTEKTAQVPARRAFALRDAIVAKQETLGRGGIFLTQCMDYVAKKETSANRVIVITDEQDCDAKLKPETAKLIGRHNYILNVASYDRAISFGRWTTINGWSERVIDWIHSEEYTQGSND